MFREPPTFRSGILASRGVIAGGEERNERVGVATIMITNALIRNIIEANQPG